MVEEEKKGVMIKVGSISLWLRFTIKEDEELTGKGKGWRGLYRVMTRDGNGGGRRVKWVQHF